jgi:uncharacterized protein (TIGR00369 family)
MPPDTLPLTTVEDAQRMLNQLFAPWVQALGLLAQSVQGPEVCLRLPVRQAMVHGGGVVCGQTLMAAADTAMVLAISAQFGAFQPMTTVQLNSSFLRPVPTQTTHLDVIATVLRPGRQIVFGSIDIRLPDGKLAMQATTTYALL